MTPKTFFRWVAWLLVLAITVFTLGPVEIRPVTGASVSVERFVAYALLGTTFSLGYPKHRLPILVLLIAAVGFLEFTQNYVPGRHGHLSDGLIKASGAFLGATLATLVTRRGLRPFRWMPRRGMLD
jgi:VanZ family protein